LAAKLLLNSLQKQQTTQKQTKTNTVKQTTKEKEIARTRTNIYDNIAHFLHYVHVIGFLINTRIRFVIFQVSHFPPPASWAGIFQSCISGNWQPMHKHILAHDTRCPVALYTTQAVFNRAITRHITYL